MTSGRGIGLMINLIYGGTNPSFSSPFPQGLSLGHIGLVPTRLILGAAIFFALWLLIRRGGLLYNDFLSTLVLCDILADNAFIIIAAIGTTFVILSGGIDLSIGSVIGFVGVVMANLVVGWRPLVSGAMMLCAWASARCRSLSSTFAKSSRSSSRSPACFSCAGAVS